MLRISLLTILMLSLSVIVAKGQDSESKGDGKLKVGDMAPDWSMVGSDGKNYKLSDYRGKQAVVVAWYPMALTGG